LVASGWQPASRAGRRAQPLEAGEELSEPPAGVGAEGDDGFESVGQVYRDPRTGRLVLIGD
ncbi:MAG: hypothetical protein R3B40_32900, partial [Polyangiales bacterium]